MVWHRSVGVASHSAGVSNLPAMAIRRHSCLVGHLVGAHLETNHIPPFSQLVFAEIPLVCLRLLRANDWTTVTILLGLPPKGEQTGNHLQGTGGRGTEDRRVGHGGQEGGAQEGGAHEGT